MKTPCHNSLLLILCALLALGLNGCGLFVNAGGSVGTDNPTVLAIAPDSNVVAGDTVHVRIWGKDQNPVSSPEPLYDTLVVIQAEGNQVSIDVEKLNLADSSYNLEIISEQVGALSFSLSAQSPKAASGDTTPGPNDTVKIDFAEGTPIRLGADSVGWANPDSSPPSSDISGDTLLFHNGVQTALPAQWFIPSAGGSAIVYLVVLGTSVVTSFDQLTSTGTIQFNLPAGNYNLALTDIDGAILSRWPIRIQ
jgi:hypothetical protein